MPTYIGFSTQNVNQPRNLVRPGVNGGVGTITQQPIISRKYRLLDEQLVIQDILNALSIKQGDKVGQPGYGTTLWNYLFEVNNNDTRVAIEDEIRRVVTGDPRVSIQTLQLYSKDNGVLAELEIFINPFNNVVQFGFFLNRFDGSIRLLSQ